MVIIMKTTVCSTKIFSITAVLILLISPLGIYSSGDAKALSYSAMVDTDFSNWESTSEKELAAGANAGISYVWDDVLQRNVIAAKLPNGLNGKNSIYVPKVLTKGREYRVFIAYRVTAWSCISYNGSNAFDGKKPLDRYGWSSAAYTFTPTVDNACFRIGTNQDNYTIYIAELRLCETVKVSIGNSENGTGSVSAESAAIGEKVTFSASPNSGYVFKGWQNQNGNIISDKSVYEHTVTEEITLIPIFEKENNALKYYFENFEDGELFDGGYLYPSEYLSTFSVVPPPDGSYLDPLSVGKGSGWAFANTLRAAQKSAGNFDFILHTGDIVEWSKYESYWRNMIDFNSEYFAAFPFMPLSGNHESTYKNGIYEIFKHFNIALTEQDKSKGVYYSFDYGNAKFIMLDTNNLIGNKIKSDQYNWLVNTLKNSSKKWTVVSMHNPMYSVGKWGSSQNAISLALREQLADLFAEYGVDIVLQGHDHTYSKTYPIAQGAKVQKSLEYKNISGINYCTNPQGVIYIMNGAAGDQARSVTAVDPDLYELSGNSGMSSWAEIEISSDKLSVKVYKYNAAADQAQLWNSYGIIK